MPRPFAQLGDTELQRARGVARAYRQHLRTANPRVCTALDDAVVAAGEGWWLVEQEITIEPDDLVSTAGAAELASVGQGTIRQWRKRGFVDRHGHHRRLEPKTRDHRGWPMFLAADILEIAAATRRRRQRHAG
jgi:hypothetical protein